MLEKVISGGQIGADIAGLRAAKSLGIPTSGWAPKGWLTSKGPQKGLLRSFSLVECLKPGYAKRTEMNVRDGDATIRLAVDFNSPGEKCTMKNIIKYNKPYMDVRIFPDQAEDYITFTPVAKDVASWIINGDYNVINIAGNAKQWLESYVEYYLQNVFFRVLDYKMAGVPD